VGNFYIAGGHVPIMLRNVFLSIRSGYILVKQSSLRKINRFLKKQFFIEVTCGRPLLNFSKKFFVRKSIVPHTIRRSKMLFQGKRNGFWEQKKELGLITRVLRIASLFDGRRCNTMCITNEKQTWLNTVRKGLSSVG
jgi:hypothetical protein